MVRVLCAEPIDSGSNYLRFRLADPGRIGIVVAAQNIATMLAQPVVGAWIDRSVHKRWIVAGASLLVALGCIVVLAAKTTVEQVATQIVVGFASAVFPPAIAALSLGLVHREQLATRIARNEAFNHAGKVTLAIVAAFAGAHFGHSWIFGMLSGFCVGAAFTALRIGSSDIDHEAARSAGDPDGAGAQDANGRHIASLPDLISDSRIPTFLICIVLFHFGNAAMLQLVGQRLASGNDGLAGTYMSACIIAAQSVMIPVALLMGKMTGRIGRKPMFLAAYVVVGLRALLFAGAHSTALLIGIQTLDGVSAALFGVVWTLINSDLAKGTGRFSLLQGSAASAWYFGGFLSNLLAGMAANKWGFSSAFLGLAVVAACGFLLFLVRMPETAEGIATTICMEQAGTNSLEVN